MGVWSWWGLEFFVLMGGYISTAALAAQSIFRAIAQTAFLIPIGIRWANTVLLSKNVGQQSVEGCKHYFKVGTQMVLAYSVFMMIIF
jgi:Na+-driven multidrug efflux pump